MAKINLFSKRAIDVFSPERFIGNEVDTIRATEIVRDVFDEFMKRAASINSVSALLDTKLITHINQSRVLGISVKTVELEVDGRVYNLLDEGYTKLLRAEDFRVTAPNSPRKGARLKAFPVLAREGVETRPKTLELFNRAAAGDGISKYASDGEPFRRVGDSVYFVKEVNLQVEARNFTEEIAKEAQRRVDREGINVKIGAVDG